jgi:6-phosphogluconolactonase
MSTNEVLAAGCYSTAGSGRGRGVDLWNVTADGTATLLASHAVPDPSFVTWSADGSLVHAVTETSPSHLVTLRPSVDLSELELASDLTLAGSGACHVAAGADPTALIVSHYGSGQVETVRIDADGVPAEVIDLDDHAEFAEGRTPHPHQAQRIPGTDLVAVTDLGLDRVMIYDQRDDGMIELSSEISLPRGSGPRHLASDHEGSELYIALELSGRVATVVRTSPDAAPDLLGPTTDAPRWRVRGSVSATSRRTPEGDPVPDAVSHLELTADEHHLLVANRGPDTLSLFARGDQSPELVDEIDVGSHPRHFTQHAGLILVAAQESDRIDVLRRRGDRLERAAEPIPSPSVSSLVPRP